MNAATQLSGGILFSGRKTQNFLKRGKALRAFTKERTSGGVFLSIPVDLAVSAFCAFQRKGS